MEYVPCIGNSSYSFWWILLKLYRCFKDGLEICILFFQNPEIIFYHFFRIFNLDIFRALILQICIWSIYLVSATPPTVFGESFWNFTVVFRMVWRYAYCFLRILKFFFLHFNLDIFSILYATDMYREYMPCIAAYSFRPILLKLYRYFAAFLWFHMRNLSLAGYNCSGGASCMACSFIGFGFGFVWFGCGWLVGWLVGWLIDNTSTLRPKWNIYVVPISLPALFFQPYPKIDTFSDFDAIFFVKCLNKLK